MLPGFLRSKYGFRQFSSTPVSSINRIARYGVSALVLILCFSLLFPFSLLENAENSKDELSPVRRTSASSIYHDFSAGGLSYAVSPATLNLISQNDNWSGVPSFEGYAGQGLTSTEGVDPQTVLGTEFAGNALPVLNQTQVNANKSNPNAYNSGGITEFDTGTYLSLGMQGNTQADSPYIVMYLNTLGHTNITVSYNVTDIDAGSNSAVSPVALQYRVGETGSFTNLPAAFVADATDGPTIAGRITPISVLLPAVCNNQPKVQVRIMTNNPVGQGEWIGINNLLASAFVPTAANASIRGRVFSPEGTPISRATVNLYNMNGAMKTAQTNSFGQYVFSELPAGETYILEVRSKRYVFSDPTQVVTLNEDLYEVNFFSEPYENIKPSALPRKR